MFGGEWLTLNSVRSERVGSNDIPTQKTSSCSFLNENHYILPKFMTIVNTCLKFRILFQMIFNVVIEVTSVNNLIYARRSSLLNKINQFQKENSNKIKY